MNRNAGLLLSLLLLTLVYSAGAQPPPPPPNVIILITDDQGYGDLSCHGNPVLKTPNLDRLHAQAVRLTDFHVQPMCTPTRGQLLTGVHCLRNGAMNVSSGRTLLRRGIPTLANLLAARGYRTGVFGKWHLGDNYPFRPQDRSFHSTLWFPSSHIGSAPDFWNNDYFDDVYTRDGERRQYRGYTTDVFFTEAIRWMREQAAERKPFFCYIPTAAPHAPLFVPAKYREAYKDQPENVARFFGMLANIDENVGRLESFLADTGLRDDTILIFLTDNGGTAGVPVFNAGMKGRKVQLWEGGHRVPCFIRWPGGKLGAPPRDVTELTAVEDLTPTLLDLCGGAAANEKRPSFDGVSLAPLLRGEVASLPDRILVINFSRMNDPVPAKHKGAVLWKNWRLLLNKELYDLDADPHQDRNVIADHPEVAAKMRAHLDAWWREIEPDVNRHEAIVIGSADAGEKETMLSPTEWQDVFFDQGKQVREGAARNGVWNLEVARAGNYRFELRRWPREADTPIAAGFPAMPHADGEFPAGVALPIAEARLRIGQYDSLAKVQPADHFVAFEQPLKPGRIQLQTWFRDADGKELCGAYYVYVTRKER